VKVYNWKIKDKKLNIEPSAAAIGNFDGVHLGHKKVLEEAKKLSTEKKLPISVLTFEPHPREFFSSEKNNFLLQTNSQKIETLRNHGIDNLINLK
jgi:cytidyltransferase-related domain